MLKLHGYFRSSASYRVRIALNLKGIAYEEGFVHLTRNGGEQFSPDFRAMNPQSLVPVLDVDGHRISQSLAILEFLEEIYPLPALLPARPIDRAYVWQLALAVACDVHPLNNLRVLKYLTEELEISEERKKAWICHWIQLGFETLEDWLGRTATGSGFCFADSPTIADCCLIPQIFNARRFDVALEAYPTLLRIEAHCQTLDAFKRAHPSAQRDAD